ncbi:DNA mismatch repair protein MutS, partial [Patescibacteria group bacterium]|nr:DNA mismatch repair protein MutS [Patescibacteria group bacterium]
SIETVPMMKERLGNISNGLLNSACDDLIILDEMVGMINRSVNDEPPISLRDGNLIKSGYNEQLDELRSISFEGKDYIKSLQEREIKRTGISSMKIKYNRVFGYYIEVSKTNLASVPDDYIRKQTLVNAERYITPELKEYEEKVLGAEEKIVEIEYELFLEIKNKVLEFTAEIQQNARIIANIDCYLSMAIVAAANNYCEPEISENGEILVDNCRHPVIEKMSTSGAFIPNDISLNNNESLIKLITGPNMAGKSTYLRQTALVVLMAHLGSYVPADKAKICLVDRIFTRVGASDNLIKGQSTFMVEMQEAANILNNATARSLIILDEVGRGTSTYDGVSIAWAITEYIHDKIKAKTLFATHYHELISVAESLKKIKNYSVAVSEVDGGVVFLYKIVEGGVDRSYGIEVAKLAGLPTDVIRKSQQILKHLEDKVDEQGIKRRAGNYKLKFNEDQMPLFQPEIKDHPALRDIKGLDLNNMTPLQAMQKLNDLKQSVG